MSWLKNPVPRVVGAGKRIAVVLTILMVGLAAFQPSQARVVKLVVEQRAPYLDKSPFLKLLSLLVM